MLKKILAHSLGYRFLGKDLRETYIISFPKCGRTWLRLMLGFALNEYFSINLPLDSDALLYLEKLAQLNPRMPEIKLEHDDDAFFKKPEELDQSKLSYSKAKIIFLVRDPRDVVVSAYFHKLKRRNFLPEDATRIPYSFYEGELSSFIRERNGSLATLIEYYNVWARNRHFFSSFLLLRYEDMTHDSRQQLQRVLHFVGLSNIGDELINRAVQFASFENMREMESKNIFNSEILKTSDVTDNDSFKTRKGKVGGYVDYLTVEDIEFINSEISEKLSDVFGY